MEAEHGVQLASRTVHQRLFKAGLRGYVAAKKPLLRDATVRKRLAFARVHRDWTIAQWDSVLWSDESAFQLVVVTYFRSYCLSALYTTVLGLLEPTRMTLWCRYRNYVGCGHFVKKD